MIHGADPMRVAQGRVDALAALLGPDAAEEMRLTRIAAADLRKDPALLLDAVKAVGFFPGPRAVLVEDATDSLTDTVAAALAEWREGDAQVFVTAAALNARSSLRKLFEGHGTARAAALYDAPPDRGEIEALLGGAGLTEIGGEGMDALLSLSRSLDPGDFRQTVEKIGLYKRGDAIPLSAEDVAACAPLSAEAALDDVLAVVAEARTGDIAAILRRLYDQGVQPVTLCIGATRHFRTLHAAASDPGGPARGIGKVRPPVFGPRRDAMVRQAQRWGRHRLEEALTHLTDTDLSLRSASLAPQRALMERTLVRLSHLAGRGR